MTFTRPIEIVGGGLAGLSLGLALRRAGIPVTLFEAGGYPRHRVCGEFITGLDRPTIERLQLGPVLADALRPCELAWFVNGKPTRAHMLPSPAYAISRHRLDARLADAFVSAGGDLRTGARVVDPCPQPGRVLATGRRPGRGGGVGLKMHVRGLALRRELELHLGRDCYVGLARIEDDRVNVCGLFRRRPVGELGSAAVRRDANRADVLLHYLNACGLSALADRMARAEIDDDSFSAVAGLRYGQETNDGPGIQLGDAGAMTPPFTGNGMAMAFQSAALAADPLIAYAGGHVTWDNVCRSVRRALRARFHVRLRWANALHPFFLRARRQPWLRVASESRLLPFRPLFAMLH
jgi:flavin-dependent dehydrogenase